MNSAPVLRPSPGKSSFRAPYAREIHEALSDEEPYSYDPSPDEAVFDEDSHGDMCDSTSPHTSDDDLSTIPPDPDSRAPSTVYTPHKRRSPFRHTSSVRNIQLDTTPPHLVSQSRRAYQLPSPSRNGTPQSHYSTHSRPRSTRSSPSKKEKVKKEHPLVLLHLTLLPLALPYSQSLLETVLPSKKLADCKLLKEKLSASVIQERGVLIPHPRDDYELLEERLLEALELEQGALTRDGHFILPEQRNFSRAGSQSAASFRDDAPSYRSGDREDDEDMDTQTEVGCSQLCEDCGKQIQTVESDRRWDISVYAANGLMREGAWSAAWREMERVDVEIKPYISDDMKRELEDRLEEMELLLSSSSKDQLVVRVGEPVHESIEEEAELLMIEESRSGLDAARMKEIYGDQAQAKIESLQEEEQLRDPTPLPELDVSHRSSADIPLSKLLSTYVRLLLRDRRNMAIIALSAAVVLLATQIVRPATGSISGITEALPVLERITAFQQPVKSDPIFEASALTGSSETQADILSTMSEIVADILPTTTAQTREQRPVVPQPTADNRLENAPSAPFKDEDIPLSQKEDKPTETLVPSRALEYLEVLEHSEIPEASDIPDAPQTFEASDVQEETFKPEEQQGAKQHIGTTRAVCCPLESVSDDDRESIASENSFQLEMTSAP